jgi:hypothetical protein
MMKRHLKATYGMTPDEYRSKWGLPDTYTMVAPVYAERRANLAKASGFGQKRKPAGDIGPVIQIIPEGQRGRKRPRKTGEADPDGPARCRLSSWPSRLSAAPALPGRNDIEGCPFEAYGRVCRISIARAAPRVPSELRQLIATCTSGSIRLNLATTSTNMEKDVSYTDVGSCS